MNAKSHPRLLFYVETHCCHSHATPAIKYNKCWKLFKRIFPNKKILCHQYENAATPIFSSVPTPGRSKKRLHTHSYISTKNWNPQRKHWKLFSLLSFLSHAAATSELSIRYERWKMVQRHFPFGDKMFYPWGKSDCRSCVTVAALECFFDQHTASKYKKELFYINWLEASCILFIAVACGTN